MKIVLNCLIGAAWIFFVSVLISMMLDKFNYFLLNKITDIHKKLAYMGRTGTFWDLEFHSYCQKVLWILHSKPHYPSNIFCSVSDFVTFYKMFKEIKNLERCRPLTNLQKDSKILQFSKDQLKQEV